ncbi:MAG TPA: hypothetical protein VNZ57_13125, partial [Longimicrobiales bacterium]|nr:hypothetical protein [Longimicrobiales bacterium]
VFDGLLERYRFTSRESSGRDGGEVNPEMLGRVFEGLMAPDRRSRTGTFYTPARTVDRLVAETLAVHVAGETGVPYAAARRLTVAGDAAALDPRQRERASEALAGVRVLDPACGSGAFLLGALARLSLARSALATCGRVEPGIARDVVGRSLFGVDVQDDAALLCALRLWLALAVTRGDSVSPVEPLPNLDRRIRQGDALTDPLHLAGGFDVNRPVPPAALRAGIRELEALAARYVTAEPDERRELKGVIAATEEALARRWVVWAGGALDHEIAEARAAAAGRDLFGGRPADAQRADSRLRALEARRRELDGIARVIDDSGALPFFSFRVHFCEATEPGFDIVLSNPPWVRSHRWPATLGVAARQRFEVCRGGGWRAPGQATFAAEPGAGQVDLSLLFLERSLELLRPGGTLALVLPAKMYRSLYGAGARRLLLGRGSPLRIEDHGLDPKSIFHAGTFPGIVVARRADRFPGPDGGAADDSPRGAERVRVVMTRQGREPLRFRVLPEELPIVPGDTASPWLLAPPAVRAAIRRMQAAGDPLGARHRPRRGVVTGANGILVFPEVRRKLGGLALVRAEGHDRGRRRGRPERDARRFVAVIEESALRPLVRGADLAAWRFRPSAHLFWSHDDATCAALNPPPRAAAYLARHEAALRARSGWRPGLPLGAVFRLAPDALGPKVAWRDLGTTLEAVAMPAALPPGPGEGQPVVPLNTVYFIATSTIDDALLLAALFNSTPARVFARTIAERAKDSRFRFFAWTVSLLPLPSWRDGGERGRVLDLSRRAHERGGLDGDDARELDRIVAASYGLEDDDVRALAAFDAWLTGADE